MVGSKTHPPCNTEDAKTGCDSDDLKHTAKYIAYDVQETGEIASVNITRDYSRNAHAMLGMPPGVPLSMF